MERETWSLAIKFVTPHRLSFAIFINSSLSANAFAAPRPPTTVNSTSAIEVAFSPNNGATRIITKAVGEAKETPLIQAYSFGLHRLHERQSMLKTGSVEARVMLNKKPSSIRSRQSVTPSPIGIAKLSLYQAMRDQKIRKSDIARRLGWSLMQVDRVLDLTHTSKMGQIELALAAVCKRFWSSTLPILRWRNAPFWFASLLF